MPKSKSIYSVPGTRPGPVTVITQVEPLYLDKKQIAQAIPASTRTIDNWRVAGIIPFIKVGGIVLFDLAKVQAALEKRFEVRERK